MCPSAHAAAVATGIGRGRVRPRSRSSTRPLEPARGAVVHRPGQGALRPRALAADGVAGPAVVFVRSGQGEHVDPRLQTLAGLEAGVAEGDHPGRVDAGDRPGEPAPPAQVHVDIHGAGRALAELGGAGPELLALLGHVLQRLVAEDARRQPVGELLRRHDLDRVLTVEQLAQEPVADLPQLERVEVDRDGVGELVGLERRRHVEPPAQERAGRPDQEVLEICERHILGWPHGQGTLQEGRRLVAHAPGGAGAVEGRPVEGERPQDGAAELGVAPLGGVAARVAALEVARVVGLQRMPGQDRLTHRRRSRPVGGVQQLPERDCGWTAGAGVLVGAGVGDDDVLGRGQQRVEEELAVLAAGVALTAERSAEQHVVAVDGAAAREHPVVQSDQRHDAVRDRAHRRHRADGERAGAEVGARGSPGETVLQQRADVRQSQLGPAARGRRDCTGQLALQLGQLPGVVPGHLGEVAHAVTQSSHPVVDRGRGLQPGQAARQPVDQLGEPAGQVDLVAADVVERQPAAEVSVLVAAHHDAEQDPVEAGAPGVVGELVHGERPAGGGVETPAHPGLGHPATDPVEVVVGEGEASPAGW